MEKRLLLIFFTFFLITSHPRGDANAMKRQFDGSLQATEGLERQDTKTCGNIAPSQIPAVSTQSTTPFVGETSFTNWINIKELGEYVHKDPLQCQTIFEYIIKLITPLKDEDDKIINSVNINTAPVEILAFLGGGTITAKITPLLFMRRINKFCKCLPTHHIIALIYTNRLIEKISRNNFNSISFYRIYMTAFVLASIWISDLPRTIEFYAKVGGISKDELKKMEHQFLRLINFNLFVSPEEFEQMFKQIETSAKS